MRTNAPLVISDPFRLHQGQSYEDENVRLFVDVEDTPENVAFFARYKQQLKERFRQIDIWIVSYEIRLT